jgi:glycine cleavage system regulatory protein
VIYTLCGERSLRLDGGRRAVVPGCAAARALTLCYVQGMRTSLVLTLIGDDRPGLVEQLSDRILATGANWEESRMARLAGKFAGLLRVSVDADRADALAAALAGLETGGLKVVVERSTQTEAAESRPIHLEVVGNDRPGIVRDISRVLAQYQVNIEEFESAVTGAPMSGEPLFRARASLRVPPGVTIEQLRGVLEALAGELMVDVVLQP